MKSKSKQTSLIVLVGIGYLCFGILMDAIIQNVGILTAQGVPYLLHKFAGWMAYKVGSSTPFVMYFSHIRPDSWLTIVLMLLVMSGLLYGTMRVMWRGIKLQAPDTGWYHLEATRSWWILKGYGLNLLGGMLVVILERLVQHHQTTAANQQQLEQMAHAGLMWQSMTIFMAVILAPLLEEAIFRGVVMNYFGQQTRWHLNLWLSALLFGCFHVFLQTFQWTALLQYTLTGLVFAYVYHRTRQLQYSMLLHCLNNSIAMLVILSQTK